MCPSSNEWSDSEAAELKKIFYVQAYEIVEDLQDGLLRLEANPRDGEILKTIKRHVHTLKGDSNSIGLAAVGTLCHKIEDILAELMKEGRGEDTDALELLLSSVDAIHRMLAESEAGREAAPGDETIMLIDRFLGRMRAGTQEADQAAARSGPPALTEYQELQIEDALKKGLHVYDVDVRFHPECAERSAAALMAIRRLETRGTIIRSFPEPDSIDQAPTSSVMIVFATAIGKEAVKNEACVTGMTVAVMVSDRREIPAQAQEFATGQGVLRVGNARNEVLRVEASKIDAIMDLMGELIIGRSMIDEVARDAAAGAHAEVAAGLQAANSYMERAVSDLQKGVIKMRMVPLHTVFRKFPRMVRDLSADKGKKARLEISGNEAELDKSIVDALGEPLAHLVRNAVDHGIEPPAERRAASKPAEARVALKAYHEASQIVIEVSDDGRGIDTEKLKHAAVGKGLLDAEEAEKLSEREAINLIFLSGLSTASAVSETSGRGVGMDAVKVAVERLKGCIEIETAKGLGTLFRLRLPLTLAIINALLFEVGSRLYAVPVPVIAEVAKVIVDELVTVDGRKTLLLRDQIISVVSAGKLFGITEDGKKKKFVLILDSGGRKTGLLIDRLMWQQELVIKAIDTQHMQTDFIAGASILGSGKVVLILDVGSIMKKAVEEEKKKGMAAL